MSTPIQQRAAELSQRISHGYLAFGGLFNPEMANHDTVRDWLMEIRDLLDEVAKEAPPPQNEAGTADLQGTDGVREAVESVPNSLLHELGMTLQGMMNRLARTGEWDGYKNPLNDDAIFYGKISALKSNLPECSPPMLTDEML